MACACFSKSLSCAFYNFLLPKVPEDDPLIMKDQLFDPRHLLYPEDHMSQIMPGERDTPAIESY